MRKIVVNLIAPIVLLIVLENLSKQGQVRHTLHVLCKLLIVPQLETLLRDLPITPRSLPHQKVLSGAAGAEPPLYVRRDRAQDARGDVRHGRL